jgi:SAM-dependent methyltransferase
MKDYLYLHLRELPYFRALLRSVEASFYQDLDLPSPTLDVGCGDGHFVSLTFDRKIDVGLDPWTGPIHEAGKRHVYDLLVQADASRSPFPQGYFASAFSNSVLEHIPHIDAVLADVARCLKPDAPFYFCVPNERYLSELSISHVLGKGYTEWFRRISRTVHSDGPKVWEARLQKAGFKMERWWHYFSPASLRVLEWGHYFGLPSLLVRKLTGKWIIAPERWNLNLIEKITRPYASTEPVDDGAYTFYIARRN